ncbi:hypothetical protein ACJJID_02760 [Microbulbifer sp. CnH-101-G]|uniref:hypothetical protein n=1 Tax=Microbulbifer sp. CnH-101-G TaxID=3243393 RepID=UPI004039E741
MSNLLRTLTIIGICIAVLAGCTSTTSLNENELIHPQIRTKKIIQREALLMSGQDTWEEVQEGEESYFRGAPYQLYDKDPSSNSWRKTGWLPVGTEIEITNVTYVKTFSHDYIKADGLVFLSKEKPLHFVYSWRAYSKCLSIKRAPWESQSVPEKRKIKELGCYNTP